VTDAPRTTRHVGWQGDNVVVQDARRPFRRRIARLLQVHGLAAVGGLPSEQRIAAGIDTLGFYSYPLLFYSLFPGVSLSQLRALSMSGSFLFDHVLCLDVRLDRLSPPSAGAALLNQALYHEAITRLHALFPSTSAFWGHFDRYYEHFAQAVLFEESLHRSLVHSYEEQDLEMIYSGKAAMAKACLAALAVLDGNEAALAPLEASHDAFYVGFQLADDLADWQLDYARRHYSYPLTRAFLSAGWERRVESANPPAVAEVGDLLTDSGAVEEARTLALDYFDRAERTLDRMPAGSWQAAIRHTRERVLRFQFDRATSAAPVAETIPARNASAAWTGASGIVVPIAAAWRRWLDPAREPRIPVVGIRDEQRRVLEEGGVPATTGIALCTVGLAIAASIRAFPEHPLEAHLGVSAGELDWLRGHDAWLDALLELGINDPPELWTAADHVSSSALPQWVPPAVGRYLGHRMVARCARDLPGVAAPTVGAILAHDRRQRVA
jgi:hypothetical protein